MLKAERNELSTIGSAYAGAATAIAIAIPTEVAINVRFTLITEETLIDNSHINNTVG
ncbi:MAG: hypothetical protein NVS4B6_15690 [Mycobacterium sp.]